MTTTTDATVHEVTTTAMGGRAQPWYLTRCVCGWSRDTWDRSYGQRVGADHLAEVAGEVSGEAAELLERARGELDAAVLERDQAREEVRAVRERVAKLERANARLAAERDQAVKRANDATLRTPAEPEPEPSKPWPSKAGRDAAKERNRALAAALRLQGLIPSGEVWERARGYLDDGATIAEAVDTVVNRRFQT